MFDPDHIDYDDVAADIEAAAEETEEALDPFADPADKWDDDDGATDRAYDMWLDRQLGVE